MQPTINKLLFLLVTMITAGGGAYFGTYLREKRKNRATAEDIDRLTRAVEAIKTENAAQLAELAHQNGIVIEQLKARHQLRVAAIDRRLAAHQEAYELWRTLISTMHSSSSSFATTVMACQTWWDRNCLYLESEPRQAFYTAYMMAGSVRQRSEYGSSMSQDALKAASEHERKIYECGEIIVQAVALPSLAAGAEKERISKS
jgi:hypothetical protein